MKSMLLRERGQALILVALAAIGLFAVAGLAIDGSARFSDRRHAQNAADAAALAGALGKSQGDNATTWKYKAKVRAQENGYDSDFVSNTVTVNSCDEAGANCPGMYAGSPQYIQVIIESTINTYFARVVGINQLHNTVQALAQARTGGPLFDGASFVSLNPNPNCSSGGGSGGGSFDVGGNGTINLNGGGIFVNSNASCGYSQTSCSVILNIAGGAGISSAGSDINQSCSTSSPEDQTKAQLVVPDEVYMPDRPDECDQTPLPANQTGVAADGVDIWTVHPGYYTDFPQAGLIANNKHIVLESGVYCVDSDIHWSGATFKSLDGSSGVTIYITAGHGFSININSPIDLDASNSGEYAGYLIILDGNRNSIQSCTINGGSYLTVDGTIFTPYCNITINGDNSSQSNFNAQVIGWDVKLNGGNIINFTYNPSDNAINKAKVGLMR